MRPLAVAALGVALAAAGVLAVVAIREAERADEHRDTAASRALAASAMENLDRAPDVAILLALEAYRRVEDGSFEESYEARHSLVSALTRHPRLRAVHRVGDDTVAAVTFSADGSKLAASDARGEVRVWSLGSGTETRMVGSGQGSCWSPPGDVDLRFAPGGALVQAACGVAAPFDLDTGKRRRRLGGSTDSLGEEETDGVLSPDGRMLAWHGEYTGFRLLDTGTGSRLRGGLDSGRAELMPIAFTGDGSALAAYRAYSDGPVRLWDVATGAPRGKPLARWLLALAPAGDRALLRRRGEVVIWDVGRGAAVGRPLAVAAPLRAAFDPTGTRLAVSSDDGQVRVWRLAGARRTLVAQLRHDGVAGLRFSPDGRLLATGGVDGTARVWDVSSRLLATRIRGAAEEVAFSPDGRWLAANGESMALWSVADGSVVGEPRVVSRGIGWSATFSPDGDTIASVFTEPGAVGLWDVERGRPRMPHRRTNEYATTTVAFSPDGSLLASAGDGARLWDAATGSPIGKRFGSGFDSVAFGPDGRLLAAWNGPDSYGEGALSGVTFWDVDERARVGGWLRTEPTAVAFGRDGMLAVVRGDGRVELWDVADRSLVDTLRAHTATSLGGCCSGGTTLAFSPDGRTLATGGLDGVRLWDLARRAPLGGPLVAPRTWDVAIGADNELVSAGDGGVLLWDRMLLSRDLDEWRDRLCPIASRDLTKAEWERFLPDERRRKTCPDGAETSGSR